MKIETIREKLLTPLQTIIGATPRKSTLPILSHVHLVAAQEGLTMTATDLEVELSAFADIPILEQGKITIPARRFYDVVKAFPENGTVKIDITDKKAIVKCGRSRFVLTTLPATDFPTTESLVFANAITINEDVLRNAISKTCFAMATNDVRYYLNGALFEIDAQGLRLVATDGHRLSAQEMEGRLSKQDDQGSYAITESMAVIIPKKGILELQKLLSKSGGGQVHLSFNENHIRAVFGSVRMTSKLIDGKFPDYHRVIPKSFGTESLMVVCNRKALKEMIDRVSIVLTGSTDFGVALSFEERLLRITAKNSAQEECEDEMDIDNSGGELMTGMNYQYLSDALGAVDSELVKISLVDSTSAMLLEPAEGGHGQQVIMPTRI